MAGRNGEWTVYVGCYTTPDRSGRGEGIRAYRMDAASGDWRELGTLARVANPSFLALHPDGTKLYCVHGGEMSEVSAFAIEDSDQLRQLGTWSCGGLNPVHLDFSRGATWLVVANYTGASIAALPVHPDGQLADAPTRVALSGPPGPDAVQQASPHPHDIPFDPTRSFVIVPDKGLDRVFAFRFEDGQFIPTNPPFVTSAPGAGPRHAAFHPERPWVYVVNELNSTITAYTFDTLGDALTELQTLPSIPAQLEMRNTGSEILVHPSGRFVYVSNRGHDSVGLFEIDQSNGCLRAAAWFPTGGKTPRAIALDPTGDFLYAANQASDSIVTFRVDPATGHLRPTGQVIATGSPSSIVFLGPRGL